MVFVRIMINYLTNHIKYLSRESTGKVRKVENKEVKRANSSSD